MDSFLVLLLGVGATARLTALVTADRILLAPRRWVLQHVKEGGLLSYLVTCDACVSVYTGGATAAALWAWPVQASWVCGALTLSMAATLLLTAREDGTL